MAKDFVLVFGTGDPTAFSGLSPTFIQFRITATGVAEAAPGITEQSPGSGLYRFSYGPTVSISFVADGGAALASGDRYIRGVLDPVQAVDQAVGTVDDSFGSTSTDPSTLFGYAKRALEFNEGDAVFTKLTGIWDISSRGSSTLLRVKTLTDTTTSATKS